MGRPAALRGVRSRTAAPLSLSGRNASPKPCPNRSLLARRRLVVRAATRKLVPAAQASSAVKQWARRWKELAQYSNPEAMEQTVSRDDLSYEEKVAWLARYYSIRPLQVGGRLIKVLSLGARAAITWALEERLPEGAQKRRGEVLRDALSSLGPVFVKVGQTLATRPDIVGDEAAEYLTQLQEKNTPFPSEKAFAIIRDEFCWNGPLAGNHLEGIAHPEERPLFAELGEEPVAAASLGQVYKGRMMPLAEGVEGLPVAVKVMRPHVGRQIAMDVYIIRLCLGWLQRYWGTEAELPNISNEVGAGLFRELDYHQEARNIEEFRQAHSFQRFLRIPKTFPNWTTQHVLCMEWVDGKRKSQLDDREKLAMVKMGVDCCMAQLLQTGIIHADPHDGNMMLSGPGQLCLIDFGLVTKITVEQQEAMASAILHTLAEEWVLLVEDMKIMGLLPEVPAIWIDPVTGEPTSPLQQGVWKEMREEEFTEVFTASMTSGGKQRSFSQITEQLCDLASSYKVNLPTWLVLIIRSMLTLDGFASAMNYNPIEAAYPHAIRRALAPVTQRGREALKAALLTPTGDVNWPRLTNLLGNDDALREAAEANAARAEEAVLATHTQEERPEELHIDAVEEAKRVVQELMVSCEGKALRRLMYSANTSSILARLFAKDAIQAALGQASGITAVVRLAAAQIEARVAKSFGWATRIIRAGSSRDSHVRSVRACACVCTVVGEGAPVSYL
mmetsp:Transcript_6804/g.19130  ORF Transcript_6804/g.19130 Transcript_6804/m.19130 type:complete len:730 (+) Transcript_6804:220-2409(+)